jgi:hypothetical protein
MDCVSIADNMTAACRLLTDTWPPMSCEVMSRDSPCFVLGTPYQVMKLKTVIAMFQSTMAKGFDT